MASNKTYTVVKDSGNLKELKTLAAAKKLADAEGAKVLCDGECVYQGAVTASAAAVYDMITPAEYGRTFMNTAEQAMVRAWVGI